MRWSSCVPGHSFINLVVVTAGPRAAGVAPCPSAASMACALSFGSASGLPLPCSFNEAEANGSHKGREHDEEEFHWRSFP